MSEAILSPIFNELGIAFDAALQAKFHRYFELLAEWNQKMNLTAIVDEEGVYEKHFLDSILPAKTLSFEGKSVLDIGSGAGFPGLVIALLYPSSKVTVLDATAKKFVFLKTVCEELGLTNVSFVNGRIEESPVARESFDVTISRGFAALGIFLECGAPFTKIGGHILAMKGASYQEEMDEASPLVKKLGLRYAKTDLQNLPSAGMRANVLYDKVAFTPKKFPRRWDEMKRGSVHHG